MKNAARVLLFEVNEITWELMEPFFKKGLLPNFRALQQEGAWARTMADEPPGLLLDPWITWTTLLTGVPQSEHGMVFLEQPPETLNAKRVWDFVDEAGKKVGVFGSAGTWPPKPVKGYFVPGSFSPDSRTTPPELGPIQDLNLKYTRAHAPGVKQPGLGSALSLIRKLFGLGLDAGTLAAIARVMAEVKLRPERDWKKVSLQPVVNLAFFKHLFRTHQPDFSTFHTNHVAHYQHRFFRAWRPELFEDATEPQEIAKFQHAIQYGYEVADQVLGEMMKLCREHGVILCVASSLGQQPFLPARHGNVAPETCRIRSIERLIELLGLKDRCEHFSTMAPQWNLRIADQAVRDKAVHDLTSARYQPLDKPIYSAVVVKDAIVVTPVSRHGLGAKVTCHFPSLPGAPSFPFAEMIIQEDETRKSGCHHPVGMLAFHGASVARGRYLGEMNNLDVAPTLLELMGIPVPANLHGKSQAAAVQAQASAAAPPLAAGARGNPLQSRSAA